MPDTSIDEAFRKALLRRDHGLVGTPLQRTYVEEWPTPTEVTATTFWGSPMEVVLPELVSCEIHRYGLIEPGLTALFLDVVGPDWIVFDVGAHLGYYSMLADELGASVHAFEPSDQTRPRLHRNAGERVRILSEGVWHAETILELQDFGAGHSAVTTFVSSRDTTLQEPAATYPVPVTSIDSHVKKTGVTPNLIKVDAEGAELSVLHGAEETIRSARPLITVEVGDTEVEKQSRATLEFALDLGYKLFEMTPEGTPPHVLRDTYSYGNILLAPPDFKEGT